jgi:hypothetical protein
VTADMDLVTTRRDHLLASAACRSCRMSRAECAVATQQALLDGAPLACCYDCNHPVSVRAMDALLAEVAAGKVRSVEEVDPPPIQGPAPVTFHWLLHQGEYWQPKRGPMILISSMTDTHRLHTIRMLQRQAHAIAWNEHTIQSGWLGHPLGPSGDMAVDAFEQELDDMLTDPLIWLNDTTLIRALGTTLPKPARRKRWSDLENRAEHWSDCPANRNLSDPCRCRVEHPDDPEVGPPVDRGLFDEASGRGVL